MLALELKRRGWTKVQGLLPAYWPGSEKQYEARMLLRSHLYLRVLLQADDVFARGAPELHYGMPGAYYKCLLKLDEVRVAEKFSVSELAGITLTKFLGCRMPLGRIASTMV